LAVDRPDLVHSLTLLEPALMGVPAAQPFLEQAAPAVAAWGAGDREGAMAGFLSTVCSLDWETCRSVIDRQVPGGVAQAIEDADTFFGSYLPALGAWRFGSEDAAKISRPVLSVLGTETERLFVEGRDLLHSWFPEAADCTIEGAAHLLHLQRPEPVARGVAAFLARHPVTGTRTPKGPERVSEVSA
jgi:pimeloyl-ACP methyl ester carboxylesterase